MEIGIMIILILSIITLIFYLKGIVPLKEENIQVKDNQITIKELLPEFV